MDQLIAIPDPQLAVDAGDMVLDRMVGNIEPRIDFLVVPAFEDQFQDFQFALGEGEFFHHLCEPLSVILSFEAAAEIFCEIKADPQEGDEIRIKKNGRGQEQPGGAGNARQGE